jgi:hypothetical protein
VSMQNEERRSVHGINEKFLSILDFSSFEEYQEKWIRPHILGDLETILEGAKQRWQSSPRKAMSPGRGDFLMATVILSVFDHMGMFLADRNFPEISSSENIARVARRLSGLEDVYAILAKLGRNVLIHNTWPQTALPMWTKDHTSGRTERWAFGLTFSASPDLNRHDTLHVAPWWTSLQDRKSRNLRTQKKALRLTLNVHRMHQDLVKWMDKGGMLAAVNSVPGSFERAQLILNIAGDPGKGSLWKQETSGVNLLPRRTGKVERLCEGGVMLDQIQALLIEAKRLGAWEPEPGEDRKYIRDYFGRAGLQRSSDATR